jgi:DNA-binding beta-propeller fold protein YncE
MRYIPIGSFSDLSPHDVAITSDGKLGYVPFFNGSVAQKIDLLADTVTGSVNLGSVAKGGSGGGWSIITLSPQDTAFLVSGWSPDGYVVCVSTEAMQINRRKSVDQLTGGTDQFPYPHGVAANKTFDTFYATLLNGIQKYTFDNTGVPTLFPVIAASGNPHQIQFSPDGSKYFVTCPDSFSLSYVRVYDAHNDTLIKAILVGAFPQEMDVSPSRNYLFVACMTDQDNPQPGREGSIYVIDMSSLAIVNKLYGDFWEPHDVTVDEQDGIIVIPSRNQGTGLPPHHATVCRGNPGWYSVYNLNTLQPESNKRYEVTVDPYSIATRFK